MVHRLRAAGGGEGQGPSSLAGRDQGGERSGYGLREHRAAKALLTETEERVITHYEVHMRNPADGGLLPTALAGHTRTVPRTPAFVATDRGFGTKDNETLLRKAGVKRISLPYTEDSAPPGWPMNGSGGSGDNNGGGAPGGDDQFGQSQVRVATQSLAGSGWGRYVDWIRHSDLQSGSNGDD